MLKRLVSFITKERMRFQTKHNNMFAFGFSEISRYYRFLHLISGRHRSAARRFVRNTKTLQKTIRPGTHPVSGRQLKLHDEGVEVILHLQLETEGFYLFAKILLDKIARAIEFYFGPVKKCTLDSHDDLVKRVERYAEAKGLKISEDLIKLAGTLKQDISDFRDYQIAHEKSPRTMRGTTWDDKGNVRLVLNKIYPNAKDKQVETKLVKELLGTIDKYIGAVIRVIRINKKKTNLELMRTP